MNINLKIEAENYIKQHFHIAPENTNAKQLYETVSTVSMLNLHDTWSKEKPQKKGCYFSAEFLTGRLIYNNMLNLGILKDCEEFLTELGFDPAVMEEIEDCALGNGGLGRLAACFLDSAATHGIALDGYGIRYHYGLFKQSFENGFQKEAPDDWLAYGDPWSIRRENCAVTVEFADQKVKAVPYDMPVIGYGAKTINTLRLWEAEAFGGFDFEAFNEQDYDAAFAERNRAEALCQVLYPNDDTSEGKKLRLKQQYFFTSASLQSILREYEKTHGNDYSKLAECFAVQLNDTHPVLSIPELVRLMVEKAHITFEEAFEISRNVFAYTNHTVMAEALESWDVSLFLSVIPHVYPYVVMLQNHLTRTLDSLGVDKNSQSAYSIISGNRVQMANLAVFSSRATNGVAAIHTEILKNNVLNQWYRIFPERFQNKTNGITQRRWLALCNPELSEFFTSRIGDGWIKDLTELEKFRSYTEDPTVVEEFRANKHHKKKQLCDYILKHEGISLSPDFIFDIQIKRLHEYKRQFLNALSILDTYYRIKDGSLTNYHPTVFLFGAKSAPGYMRAKGIIKFINEIAKLLANDPDTRDILKVVFVQNYNVSYAEKIIPAADISQQISTAGTEASGTGNMKLMLNGAVTLGTMDGANIEIVQQAGIENNYIFGAEVDEIESLKGRYDSLACYNANPRIRKALDTLIDGTFDDGGSGVFKELHDSILKGASWHTPDHYFLLHDFISYCDIREKANAEYRDRAAFSKKCLLNAISAGKFSSDRTILEYHRDIWCK